MDEGISAKVVFAVEGMQKNTELMAGILTGIKRMAITIGISAAFYQAIEPLLRPVLTLFKMVLMMLFLPLIPLLKPFMKNMGALMQQMASAQKDVADSGGDAGAQFSAGLGVLLSSGTFWGVIGVIIAGAFLKELVANMVTKLAPAFGTLAQKMAGVLSIGWAANNAYDALTKPGIQWMDIAQTGFFTGAGLKFLGMKGATAAEFGGWTALILLAVEIALNPESTGKFIADATNIFMKLWDAFKGIMEVINPVNWMTKWMTGKEIDTSGITSMFGDWGDKYMKGYEDEMHKLEATGKLSKTLQNQLDLSRQAQGISVSYDIWKDPTTGLTNYQQVISNTTKTVETHKSAWQTFFTFWKISSLDQIMRISGVGGIGEAIGKNSKGSYPMVYSLNLAAQAWTDMANVSKTQISGIISELNRIPREIVTVHKIVTVTSSK